MDTGVGIAFGIIEKLPNLAYSCQNVVNCGKLRCSVHCLRTDCTHIAQNMFWQLTVLAATNVQVMKQQNQNVAYVEVQTVRLWWYSGVNSVP
jgi:hypothetical protein